MLDWFDPGLLQHNKTPEILGKEGLARGDPPTLEKNPRMQGIFSMWVPINLENRSSPQASEKGNAEKQGFPCKN